MSREGSQWWPPESEDEEGQPSGPAGGRRPNPILTADQRRPAPDVAAVLAKTARLVQGESGVVKVTVRLPVGLVKQIKQEAYALTNHRRRGFQDLVTIFLQYGLRAYQAGELELELAERVVEVQIVAKG